MLLSHSRFPQLSTIYLRYHGESLTHDCTNAECSQLLPSPQSYPTRIRDALAASDVHSLDIIKSI